MFALKPEHSGNNDDDMIKEEYIERAKDSVTMHTLFKDLYPNAKLRKCGTRFRCNCVWHAENTPSLYIDTVNELVHCFGCGRSYSRIGLVKEAKGVGFKEAVEFLLTEYGKMTDLSDIYAHRTPEEAEQDKRREAQMVAMQYVQQFYTEQYHADNVCARDCRDYAEKRKNNPRGRWDEDKIMTFGFGYAPSSGHALVDWAYKKGINLDTLADIGVVVSFEDKNGGKRYKDLFRDRLTIPQRNSSGMVIAYTARRLSDRGNTEPKYMNSRCPECNLIYKKDRTIFGIGRCCR